VSGLSQASGKGRPRKSVFSPLGPDAVLSVELATPGSRSREVKTRSKTRASGAYPSFRMGRNIHWESPGERNAIKLLDVDSGVLNLGEQPCVIHYRLAGELHRHYPDLLVERRQVKVLFEVKERKEALSREVIERTALMRTGLPRFGYEYDVLIAEDLCKEPRISNVNFVLRHGRAPLNLMDREEIRLCFLDRKVFLWSDVLRGQAGALTLSRACRLILEGQLSIDFEKSWSGTSLVCTVVSEKKAIQ
jgi:hypothetical protein